MIQIIVTDVSWLAFNQSSVCGAHFIDLLAEAAVGMQWKCSDWCFKLHSIVGHTVSSCLCATAVERISHSICWHWPNLAVARFLFELFVFHFGNSPHRIIRLIFVFLLHFSSVALFLIFAFYLIRRNSSQQTSPKKQLLGSTRWLLGATHGFFNFSI